MRSAVLGPLFGALALAQSSAYSNFETQFLSETNSLGVVTGQPTPDLSVYTSQPSVVTSQPSVNLGTGVTTPAVVASPTPSGMYLNSTGVVVTRTTPVVVVTSGAASSGASGTQSASATFSSAAANAVQVGGSLAGLGALLAALL